MSAADLASIQACSGASLTTPCTIEHVIRAPDGMLGRTITWSTPVNTFCRIAPVKRIPQVGPAGGEVGVVNTFHIVFPFGTSALVGDRITIGGVAYLMIRPEPSSEPSAVLTVCQVFQ